MKIEITKEKDRWDSFVLQQEGSFLQSFSWGELKRKEGNNVFRFIGSSENKIIFGAQVIEEKLPFSRFYYHIPYGPLGKGGEEYIAKEAKKRGAKFLFVEPWSFFSTGEESSFRIEPQKTSVISLKEDLISSFRKDTRYNIRIAQKKEIEVKEEDYDKHFYFLLKKLEKRQGFSSYPSSYFPLLLENTNSVFFSARYKGKIIAAAIVILFGKRATYLHAVSDHDFRELRAPSLLQLFICEELYKRGFKEYDLWGVDDKFPGVSHFKKGFNGREVVYPSSKKIVFSPLWYNSYRFGKKIKRIL